MVLNKKGLITPDALNGQKHVNFQSHPLNLRDNIFVWVKNASNLSDAYAFFAGEGWGGIEIESYNGIPLTTRAEFERMSGVKLEEMSWESIKFETEQEKLHKDTVDLEKDLADGWDFFKIGSNDDL